MRVDPGEKWVQPQAKQTSEESRPERVSTKDLFQTESEPGDWLPSLTIAQPLNSSVFWFIQILGASLCLGLLFGRPKKETQNSII